MKTTYILKLSNKRYLNHLLRYQIKFNKIEYQNDICFLYVDSKNYQKLVKYFQLYDIKLYRITGLLKYNKLIKNNIVSIISALIGIVFLYLLSNIIFDVKIMTNNSELIKIINNELIENNLVKYHLVKSFNEKELIKNKIISEHKDKLEWLEIERVGSKYYIHLLERIINSNKSDTSYQHVISRKNAVIKEIKSSSGEIVKKINDYVNKGDIIISGNIMKKDEIKNTVKAEGKVYGETWYIVRVELPRTYSDSIYTGNSYNKISFNFFNKRFFLFNKKKYTNEDYQDMEIISNKLLPFSINKTKVLEVKKDTFFYTYQEASDIGLSLAKEKLLNNLNVDSKILLQKKLKLYEENSTIIIEVFFKVYEDITDYQKIVKDGD